MAVMDVVLYPDDPLTLTAGPIEDFGPALARLASDMVETMDAFDGVGLAGPQVGVSKRILVLREPGSDEPVCLVNPEILSADGQETAEEGCLSLPNLYAEVTRAARITVRATNPLGKVATREASGLLARIIQHEMDHLDGRVILDRLDLITRDAKMREWEAIRQQLGAGAESR
jgi:peptide deformylase